MFDSKQNICISFFLFIFTLLSLNDMIKDRLKDNLKDNLKDKNINIKISLAISTLLAILLYFSFDNMNIFKKNILNQTSNIKILTEPANF